MKQSLPLPNGRAIPVDMQGQSAGGQPIVVNFNLPENADVESFKQSQAQITARERAGDLSCKLADLRTKNASACA